MINYQFIQIPYCKKKNYTRPSKAHKNERQLSDKNCECSVFITISKTLFILHVMHSFKCTEDPSRYSYEKPTLGMTTLLDILFFSMYFFYCHCPNTKTFTFISPLTLCVKVYRLLIK